MLDLSFFDFDAIFVFVVLLVLLVLVVLVVLVVLIRLPEVGLMGVRYLFLLGVTSLSLVSMSSTRDDSFAFLTKVVRLSNPSRSGLTLLFFRFVVFCINSKLISICRVGQSSR